MPSNNSLKESPEEGQIGWQNHESVSLKPLFLLTEDKFPKRRTKKKRKKFKYFFYRKCLVILVDDNCVQKTFSSDTFDKRQFQLWQLFTKMFPEFLNVG